MKSLDEIMSGEGEAMPASEEQNPAIETPPEPVAEAASAAEAQPEGEAHEGEQSGMVPVGALQAERAKGRKYTEELAETRRTLDELRAMVLRQQQPQPQPVQPQPAPEIPDLWTDPDKYVAHQMQQALAPLQQTIAANARMAAEAIHDREAPGTVKAAVDAFNAAHAQGQIDPASLHAIDTSPNPFAAAVQWHQRVKRQEALSKYGDDPDAAIEAEVQRRLAALQGGQAQPSPQTAQAMPTSFSAGRSAGPRTAPTWSGPKPLSEIMNGR